jgi:hypothetical protein
MMSDQQIAPDRASRFEVRVTASDHFAWLRVGLFAFFAVLFPLA